MTLQMHALKNLLQPIDQIMNNYCKGYLTALKYVIKQERPASSNLNSHWHNTQLSSNLVLHSEAATMHYWAEELLVEMYLPSSNMHKKVSAGIRLPWHSKRGGTNSSRNT